MAENIENNGCSQRDNAEHEGYVKASRSFNRIWKERDSAQPRLLDLYKRQDVERKRKFVCVDPHDMPIIAIVDPDMMSSCLLYTSRCV